MKKIKKTAIKKAGKSFEQNTNDGITASRFRKKSWNVTGVAERDIPRFDREQAMAKARQFTEQNPLVMGMVQTFVDNVVSNGFRLSMATNNTEWNRKVEQLWHDEKDDLDIRGVRTWGKLLRCWQYRKIVDGDVGIYHNYIDPVTGEFHVQTIEADRIRSKKYDILDQGIEFDPATGKPKRYFIGPRPKDQLDISKQLQRGTPVDASDFCLYAHYPTDRADMLRGVTMLLPMFNSLQDIGEIMNAILQKIKNAAFMCFKNTIKPSPTGDIFGPAERTITNEDGTTRRTRALAPMSMADLSPDEDIAVVESNEPSPNVEQFMRYQFRYAGSSIGMPLEFMLNDLGSLNYSSARALFEMAKRRFRCEQEALKRPCDNVFKSWLSYRISQGILTPPKGIDGSVASHRWVTPSWPYLDPQAEIQAQGLALGYGLTTIRRILSENSDIDFEALIAERKEEVEAFEKAGIPVSVGLPGSKMAGNPVEEVAEADGLKTSAPKDSKVKTSEIKDEQD